MTKAAEEAQDGYWFMNVGEEAAKPQRQWEDCMAYGFLLAGGTADHIKRVKQLRVGDRVFAYLTGHGYVGLAEVTASAIEFNRFRPEGQSKELPALPMKSTLNLGRLADPATTDWCVAVKWINALPRTKAVLMSRNRRGTLVRIREDEAIADLEKAFLPAK